jgi:hypothetical protein
MRDLSLNAYKKETYSPNFKKEEESFKNALKRALKVNLLGTSPWWIGAPVYVLLHLAANSLGYNIPLPEDIGEGLLTSIGFLFFAVGFTILFSPLLLLRKYLPKREFLKDLS